ncbi:hypothetical protein LPTSP3_g29680 [Leptospira kobayashii]|uniref:Uncharacterized protein n=1 Tax=Leptospira kobayashii TaxID=1917830 RepID=A0ABN6KFW4_9LEPT|nr:hypothetical protein [Leptospira kobayashii]BDA80038.1 hypothetical protein LPTSP3_g29680 [Leptospira kobayashii]
MPDFDRIDLMNYAIYGNDFDSQWDEIRAYLKSNAGAQRELEEIKRTLPAPQTGKRRRDTFSVTEGNDQDDANRQGADPNKRALNDDQTKSWWKKLIGE